MMIESGALFVWYFHYMPVGNSAVPELLPTPQQREEMYKRIRHFRETKAIFGMDFQNDGQFVGGCIAGGRRYLHINAKGDVEPCVFIHYSNVNIHDCTLLEALKSPIFRHIMTTSRLMTIICVHVRCLKIRKNSVRWLKKQALSTPIIRIWNP